MKSSALDDMEEQIYKDMLEHDLVVSIPPKKSYDVQVRIDSIEKGKPMIDNSIIDIEKYNGREVMKLYGRFVG